MHHTLPELALLQNFTHKNKKEKKKKKKILVLLEIVHGLQRNVALHFTYRRLSQRGKKKDG
jgi:ABC-type transporter MlaC component